ncbi:MAG: ATP-binding protein [Burkholderiales bacterium]
MDTKGVSRGVLFATVYVAVYVLLDWISYIHPVMRFAITAWNPPPGVSLAFLLLFGLRFTPALFVSALLADLIVRSGHESLSESLFLAAILAVGYSMLAFVFLRWLKLDALRGLRDLTVFTLVTTLFCMLVAACYIGAHAALGLFPWQSVPGYALRFWVGDVIGILVITPFLLSFASRRSWDLSRILSWQIALPGIAIALALWVVFGIDPADSPKLFYVLFLPLIWTAMWHGFQGATMALLAIQAGLIFAIEAAPFTAATMLEFQLLMLALAITGLYLGMTETERETSQHALREKERALDGTLRSAALSGAASALAHELNQPLSAALTYAQAGKLLLAQGASREQIHPVMDKLHAEVTRAGEVVRRLREFYRSGSIRPVPSAIDSLIEEATGTLRMRAERAGIALTVRCPPGLPKVLADRIHITIVLHNLITNAIEAITQADCEARQIQIEARYGPKGMVRVSVEDTGPGISLEQAEDVFEPFATSKMHGMGVGLSMSKSIVETHGGRLWVERFRPGACICLTLPADSQTEGKQ